MGDENKHEMIYKLKCMFFSMVLGVSLLIWSFLNSSNSETLLIYSERNRKQTSSNMTYLFNVKRHWDGDGDLEASNRTIRKKASVMFIDERQYKSKRSTVIEPNITLNRYFFCRGPSGRLGNQLFDFASSLGIARLLNYTFVIRSSHKLLSLFDTNQLVVNKKPKNLIPIHLNQWRNNSWRKNGTFLAFNLTLAGYYRVWSYFKHVTNDIKTSLTIKNRFLDKANTFLHFNTPRNRTIIGLHVRRGDYLMKTVQKFGKAVASKKYITLAMMHFQKRYNDSFFIVVSDDKPWCNTNLAGHNVVVSQSDEAIVDFAILTLCHHTIITSGTFGWWGGWLAGGEVVYWTGFPRPGSRNEKEILFRGEYYPPHWTGLDSD